MIIMKINGKLVFVVCDTYHSPLNFEIHLIK